MEPGTNAYIAYANGVRGYLTGWKRNPQDYVLHLIGTQGRIEVDVEGWRMVKSPVSDSRMPVPGLGNPTSTAIKPRFTYEGMSAAIRELLRALETGEPTISSGETARRTVAITDAILRSQAAGNARVDVVPPPWGEK